MLLFVEEVVMVVVVLRILRKSERVLLPCRLARIHSCC